MDYKPLYTDTDSDASTSMKQKLNTAFGMGATHAVRFPLKRDFIVLHTGKKPLVVFTDSICAICDHELYLPHDYMSVDESLAEIMRKLNYAN